MKKILFFSLMLFGFGLFAQKNQADKTTIYQFTVEDINGDTFLI